MSDNFFKYHDDLCDTSLSNAERTLANFIRSYTTQNLECYVSNHFLAHKIGFSERSAQSTVKALVDKLVIKSVITKPNGRSKRVLTYVGIPEKLVVKYIPKEVVTHSPEEKMIIKKAAIVKTLVKYNVGTKEEVQEALGKYTAAYELFKLDSNVNIQEAPNDTIIMQLMQTDWVKDAEIEDFETVLTNRFNARLLKGKQVNLSWLIMTELDERAREGILCTEGE